MATKPVWLPEMFPINPWTEQTFNLLYEIFRRDFKDSQPTYRGITVWFFPEKDAGKELIFWHLTTRDDKESGERLIDFRRSERLPWARPMLVNADAPEVLDWDYEEGDGTIQTYVWLKDFDYLMILKKYPDGGRRLVTSFWIEYSNMRRKLEKKCNRRIQIA